MTTTTKSTLNGIILLLVLGLTIGCASNNKKKPFGAHARAEKGVEIIKTDDDLPPQPVINGTPLTPTELDPDGTFGMCDRIHFDYDKSEIKAEWEKCLNNIAKYFAQHEQYLLLIEGHCDERGTDEYNIALGERRSQATAQYLIQRGISPERIVTKSWGESKALATGHDESSWKLNRRAEFFGVQNSR